jgi:hypothetical protein
MDLTQEELPKLEAMAAMYESDPNPFQELVELVEKYEAIRIWPEY